MNRIELSEENKQAMLKRIQVFFKEERDEELGDLATLLMLDFVVDKLGGVFYNQGIEDAIQFMSDKTDDLYGLKI